MRPSILLPIAVAIALLSSESAVGAGEEWVERYDGPASDWDQAYAIAVCEGGVFVTGSSYAAGPNPNYATVRYGLNGGFDWVATYDGPAGSTDYTADIVADASGNTYVTGKSEGDGTFLDVATVKYDAEGDEVWVARYDGPASDWDEGVAIALDDSGNVYVAGKSSPVVAYSDFLTIKYGADGSERWAATYDGPVGSTDMACDIAVDAEGYVYVTGESAGDGTSLDITTIRYAPDGTEDWVARYNGPGNSLDQARAMALDDSANVYVTGTSHSGDADVVTIKYDSEGNEKWAVVYDGPSNHNDYGVDIAVAASGHVLVLGQSYDMVSGFGWVTISYTPDGIQSWLERYDGPGSGNDQPSAIAVDGAGKAYATGYVQSGPLTTLRYGQSGGLEWMATYEGPSEFSDIPRDITVDAAGCVYVTGESYDDVTAYDFVTLKYDPATGVAHDEETGTRVRLFPASPNPSGGSTEIAFEIATDVPRATLAVYGVAGELVSVILDGPVVAGPRTVTWDGTDGRGVPVAAGVYFVKLTAGDETATRKIVLVR
jgi:hypothetical protein